MTKYIHIHAKCNTFEIFEQVCQSKAVGRLIKIRNMFEWQQRRKDCGTLSVKTIVVNPELQLR